ncbi:MAG: hypothetical protein QXK06_01395 [Candidatus Diapherotrites archaeon]
MPSMRKINRSFARTDRLMQQRIGFLDKRTAKETQRKTKPTTRKTSAEKRIADLRNKIASLTQDLTKLKEERERLVVEINTSRFPSIHWIKRVKAWAKMRKIARQNRKIGKAFGKIALQEGKIDNWNTVIKSIDATISVLSAQKADLEERRQAIAKYLPKKTVQQEQASTSQPAT